MSDEIAKWYEGRPVVSINDFSRKTIDYLFNVSDKMKQIVQEQGGCDLLKGKILATVFYEPSTRTMMSFNAAMYRLGGQVLSMSDVKNSSVAKGETLGDTVRCIECYVDAVVLRHPEIGSAKEAASYLSIPLLNGGDGAGEHPTQALLDAFTIHSELGKIDGLTITMVGDLKHGRTVHSLAKVLKHYKCKVNYVSPDFLSMPEEIQNELKQAGVEQHCCTDVADVIPETDILYVTRVQKERFADLEEYKKAAGCYVITPQSLAPAKATMRVLHPLPRVDEIDHAVDADPRAAYFREMKNGMYVRMALLALVLGKAQQL